jgi:hypothetical protein
MEVGYSADISDFSDDDSNEKITPQMESQIKGLLSDVDADDEMTIPSDFDTITQVVKNQENTLNCMVFTLVHEILFGFIHILNILKKLGLSINPDYDISTISDFSNINKVFNTTFLRSILLDGSKRQIKKSSKQLNNIIKQLNSGETHHEATNVEKLYAFLILYFFNFVSAMSTIVSQHHSRQTKSNFKKTEIYISYDLYVIILRLIFQEEITIKYLYEIIPGIEEHLLLADNIIESVDIFLNIVFNDTTSNIFKCNVFRFFSVKDERKINFQLFKKVSDIYSISGTFLELKDLNNSQILLILRRLLSNNARYMMPITLDSIIAYVLNRKIPEFNEGGIHSRHSFIVNYMSPHGKLYITNSWEENYTQEKHSLLSLLLNIRNTKNTTDFYFLVNGLVFNINPEILVPPNILRELRLFQVPFKYTAKRIMDYFKSEILGYVKLNTGKRFNELTIKEKTTYGLNVSDSDSENSVQYKRMSRKNKNPNKIPYSNKKKFISSNKRKGGSKKIKTIKLNRNVN